MNILNPLPHRRGRLGGSNVIRHLTSRSSWSLSTGGQRLPLAVPGTAGFDMHVVSDSPLMMEQSVTILSGASDMEPGIVRWVIGQDGGFLTGCELLQGYGYAISGVTVPPE